MPALWRKRHSSTAEHHQRLWEVSIHAQSDGCLTESCHRAELIEVLAPQPNWVVPLGRATHADLHILSESTALAAISAKVGMHRRPDQSHSKAWSETDSQELPEVQAGDLFSLWSQELVLHFAQGPCCSCPS